MERHLPFDYFSLICHTFERPVLVMEDGVRSFGGVNERYWPTWGGWVWLPENPTAAYDNLWTFYSDRWEEVKAHYLAAPLDLFYFDFAFNSGGRTACRELQRECNRNGHELIVDGLMGPLTVSAAAGIRPIRRIGANYLARRMAFLRGLPNWDTNADGWTKRIGKLTEFL